MPYIKPPSAFAYGTIPAGYFTDDGRASVSFSLMGNLIVTVTKSGSWFRTGLPCASSRAEARHYLCTEAKKLGINITHLSLSPIGEIT